MAEQKFGGDPQPLGGGTPSIKCKKVSGTNKCGSAKRSVEQKKQNKNLVGNGRKKMVGALGHWLAGGTPSASAKRSAEQKMAELKLAEQNWWIWWGSSAIGWQDP